MKISIGTNIKEGPWGGGNLFAINLKKFLINKNIEVVHNLNDEDIDIILITEPRKTSESSAFTHIEVEKYKKFVNSNVLVVHRLNECDERKGTKYVNRYLINANKVAHQSIFVSNWLKELYLSQGIKSKNNKVIYAGADEQIFNNENFIPWDSKGKLKIVTHHWGANWNKGFETYLLLDDLISKENWKNKISFTYIGNIPKNVKFKNVNIINPLSGKKLADEIKKNHLYITGSLNEPSGNHHIEGAQCGLPIMFLNSGGTPEYCKDFGIEFQNENLETSLKKVMSNYTQLQSNMHKYPFSSSKMCEEYYKMFIDLSKNSFKYLTSETPKTFSGVQKKIYFINKNFKRNLNF